MIYTANFNIRLYSENERFMKNFLKKWSNHRLQEVINEAIKTLENEWKDENEIVNLKCDRVDLC